MFPMIFYWAFKEKVGFETKYRIDHAVWKEIEDSRCYGILKENIPLYFRCGLPKNVQV